MNATARREPRKHGYSYREGLTMMAAQAVGIDPYLAAEAGEDPKNALNLLRKAQKTEDRQTRAELLQEAQNELRYVDAAKHPELVNAISTQIKLAQGQVGIPPLRLAHSPVTTPMASPMVNPFTGALAAAAQDRSSVPRASLSAGDERRNQPFSLKSEFQPTQMLVQDICTEQSIDAAKAVIDEIKILVERAKEYAAAFARSESVDQAMANSGIVGVAIKVIEAQRERYDAAKKILEHCSS